MKVRLLILNIIMYLVYMLPQNFFRLDYFNINKVNIQESAKMLQPELTKLSQKLYNKNIITDRLRSICEYIKANSDKVKEDETNFEELSDDTFRVVFYRGVNLVRIIDPYYDSISCDLDVTDIRITSRYNIRNLSLIHI